MTAEQIRGGLFGLLVGDALGVPYEFKPSDQLPSLEAIDMVPPAGFARSHARKQPGTWSDDGATALCLAESLVECGRLDLEDLADRLQRWSREGYLTPDGDVFDFGGTTYEALSARRNGTPAHRCGPTDERSNGNGSLMRALPLALWHGGDDAALIEDAMAQSLVTHGHPRSQVCCAVYCLWARYLAAGLEDPFGQALRRVNAQVAGDAAAAIEMKRLISCSEHHEPSGSGHVLDSLLSARWTTQQGSYADAIKHAVALGGDTDTIACIAGGIAGLRDGIEAIPSSWLDQLLGRAIASQMADRLVATMNSSSSDPAVFSSIGNRVDVSI